MGVGHPMTHALTLFCFGDFHMLEVSHMHISIVSRKFSTFLKMSTRRRNGCSLAVGIMVVATTANGTRTLQASRLTAPCAITDTYYPFRTCRISKDDTECKLGLNTFATMEECCTTSFGKDGCTDTSSKSGCWVPGEYHPQRSCNMTTDSKQCNVEWGHWATWDECCASDGSGAFPEGCSTEEPCFVPTDFYPQKVCGMAKDQSICKRGWGTFKSMDECCEPGKAFDTGCGPA